MKVQCPSCESLFLLQEVVLQGGEAVFRCQECKAETSIPVKKYRMNSPKVGPESSVSKGECPKCRQSLPPDILACPHCGLACEYFDDFFNSKEAEDSSMDSAWEALLKNWHIETAHEDFFREVVGRGLYREAAQRFKKALGHPEYTERSQKNLQRLQSMVAAMHLTQVKYVPEEEPFKKVVILLMVLLLFGAGIGMYVWSKKGGQQKSSQPAYDLTPPENLKPREAPVKPFVRGKEAS